MENTQLLHECKKDRDEYLLQVIAESQVGNDAISSILLPVNRDISGEYDMDDSDDLLELPENLDEYTASTTNATKKSTESKCIEKKYIDTVENIGRFTEMNRDYDFKVI
ncbi:unnamed protein product, partial [Rotaria sp. Silwood1]